VTFSVSPTAVPLEALGVPDTRLLGAHIDLRYEPGRKRSSA